MTGDHENGASSATGETAQKPYTVTKTKHTSTGEDVWVVSLNDKISKEEFAKLRDEVMKVGGYYSYYAKTLDGKALPGFVFKSEPDANALAAFDNSTIDESANKEIDNQEIKGEINNVRAEESRHESRTEESSQEVERDDRRRKESGRERITRRIKEILRRSSFSRNENSFNGRKTARIERRESTKAFENRMRNEGYTYRTNGKSAVAYKEAPKADGTTIQTSAQKSLKV